MIYAVFTPSPLTVRINCSFLHSFNNNNCNYYEQRNTTYKFTFHIHIVVTDHFSGPDTVVCQVCVCAFLSMCPHNQLRTLDDKVPGH